MRKAIEIKGEQFTSLAATGLGIFAVWLYNRKRTADRLANEIASIINHIEKVNGQMENGFERVALEKETVLNAFNSAKTEMEQANKDTALKQREFFLEIVEKIQNETVVHDEFRETVLKLITKMTENISKNADLIERIVDALPNNDERNINASRSR